MKMCYLSKLRFHLIDADEYLMGSLHYNEKTDKSLEGFFARVFRYHLTAEGINVYDEEGVDIAHFVRGEDKFIMKTFRPSGAEIFDYLDTRTQPRLDAKNIGGRYTDEKPANGKGGEKLQKPPSFARQLTPEEIAEKRKKRREEDKYKFGMAEISLVDVDGNIVKFDAHDYLEANGGEINIGMTPEFEKDFSEISDMLDDVQNMKVHETEDGGEVHIVPAYKDVNFQDERKLADKVDEIRKRVAFREKQLYKDSADSIVALVLNETKNLREALEYAGELSKFAEEGAETIVMRDVYDKIDLHITKKVNELLDQPFEAF